MRSPSILTLATLTLAGLAVALPTFTTSAVAATAKSKAANKPAHKTRAAAAKRHPGVHWDCRSGICVNPVGTYKYHIDPNGYVIYD
jgi:hypothetical protein